MIRKGDKVTVTSPFIKYLFGRECEVVKVRKGYVLAYQVVAGKQRAWVARSEIRKKNG